MYANPYPQRITDEEKSAGFNLVTIDAMYIAAVCPIGESDRLIKRVIDGKICYVVQRYGCYPHDSNSYGRWITLHETASSEMDAALTQAKEMIGKDYQQKVITKVPKVIAIPLFKRNRRE